MSPGPKASHYQRRWSLSFQRLECLVAVLYLLVLQVSLTASWVFLAAGLCLWLVNAVADRSRPVLNFFPLAIGLAVFAGVVTISGAFCGGPDFVSAIKSAGASLVTLRAFLVYFWSAHIFSTYPSFLKNAVGLILIPGAIAGIWATIQQLFNFHPFTYQWLQGTGFLTNPMPFAGQMQLFSMLGLGIFLAQKREDLKESRWFHNKGLLACVVGANFLGLLFAGERSAWVGGVAGALFITALISWRAALKTSLIVTTLALLAFFTVPLVHTRVEAMLSGQADVSINSRFHLWSKSVEIWQGAPLLGVGIRNFPKFDRPEAIVPGRSQFLDHAHNNFLHLLATTGLIGLASYVFILFSVLKTAWTTLTRSRTNGDQFGEGIALGLIGGFVSLMVAGLFEYNFGTGLVRLTQWFMLGMLSALLPRTQEAEQQPIYKELPIKALACSLRRGRS